MTDLVQVSGNTTKLQEFVLFHALRQGDIVKVVKVINRVAQRLVILFLNQQVIVRIVDRLVVGLLHRHKVGLDERQVVRLLKHLDDARVIDARTQHRK